MEYFKFVEGVSKRTKDKLNYTIEMLKEVNIISTKFVKRLVNTDFYELRISVEREIRIILFTVDNDNVNLAERVILLHGFVKKSTKDYDREIEKAITILRNTILL